MARGLFSPGGPHNVKSLGNDKYQLSITLPPDADGRLARECPSQECSPGYFKIKQGTGRPGEAAAVFCPYCHHTAHSSEFATKEQARYAKDVVIREAQKGLEGMVKDALGLGPSGKRKFGGGLISMEMSLKSSALPPVRRPFEDEVRRDVICPHCSLDQTVFGLATWCADCGEDIFLTHVAAEIDTCARMIADIPRRTEVLGKRVAAKDLENCLEDAVSVFEASIKILVRRALAVRGASMEEIDGKLKRAGNAFQSVPRTKEQLRVLLGVALPDAAEWALLAHAFEKRHPVAHNLGVIDRKYLERVQAAEREGREVRLAPDEVSNVLIAVQAAIAAVDSALKSYPA